MALKNPAEYEFIELVVRDVIGAAHEVASTLGGGYPEFVYQRAMETELTLRGRSVITQASHSVTYKGQFVGEYVADLIVARRVVVELKCAEPISSEDVTHCSTFLRASGLEVALLVNFGFGEVECRRIGAGYPMGHPALAAGASM